MAAAGGVTVTESSTEGCRVNELVALEFAVLLALSEELIAAEAAAVPRAAGAIAATTLIAGSVVPEATVEPGV